jgi:hypothetical protein
VFEQAQAPAQQNEFATHRPDGGTVVPPEVGDRLEVRSQAAGQPHELDVAARLGLKTPAGLESVEVAVDVDLQQRAGVVRRPTRVRRLGALKAHAPEIELVDEHVDHPHRAVFIDPVVETLGEEKCLRPIDALDESAHSPLP